VPSPSRTRSSSAAIFSVSGTQRQRISNESGGPSVGIPGSDNRQPDPSLCGDFSSTGSVPPSAIQNQTALNRCESSDRAVRGARDQAMHNVKSDEKIRHC
jgi:hypothetical protein